MILGRFYNSLQYHLKQYDRKWLKVNPHLRYLSPNALHKVVLALGRRPLLKGLFLLGFFSFLSLAEAIIDSSRWALVIVEKINIESPVSYFVSLWSIQATITGLIYPIVISFVAVLLQTTDNSDSELYIYFHDSGAIPASLYALFLVLLMGLQYLGLPYVDKNVVFFWISLDGLWFSANLVFTCRFLLRTFDFILPSRRREIVKRYTVGVAWPAEMRLHLAKELFLSACKHGFLPGPDFLSQNSNETFISAVNIGFSQDSPEISLSLRKERLLVDVRFRVLKKVIEKWQKRAAETDEIFELPVTPFATYKGSITLCSIKGKTRLSSLEKVLVRLAFVFSYPVRDISSKVTVAGVLRGMQKRIRSALWAGELEEFKTELEYMNALLCLLMKVSKDHDRNWTELIYRDFWYDQPMYKKWTQLVIELYPEAVKKINDDMRYLHAVAVAPVRLFDAASKYGGLETCKHFLWATYFLMVNIEKWWSQIAEKIGESHTDLVKSIILPPPYGHTHENAVADFIGIWEKYLSYYFLGRRGKEYSWADFSIPSELFFSHIKFTVILLFSCLFRGDRNGAEWITDVLVKWYLSIRLPDPSSYMLRPQRMFTIDMCRNSWQEVQRVLEEKGEGYLEKITPLAVFSSCLRNLWHDAMYLTVFLLVEKIAFAKQDDDLILELAGTILKMKPLRPGNEPFQGSTLIDFNGLLLSIIRQQFPIDTSQDAYQHKVSSIVEAVEELAHNPITVPGRVYLNVKNTFHMLLTGQMILLMLTVPEDWKPDAYLERLLLKWIAPDIDKFHAFQIILSNWEEWLDNPEMDSYERLRKHMGLGMESSKARDALGEAIQKINGLLSKGYQDTLVQASIDSELLGEIAHWASKTAFSSQTGQCPVNLFFTEILPTHEALQKYRVRIQRIDRGALTRPKLSPLSFEGDEEWFSDMMKENVAQRVMDQLISKLKIEEVAASTPESYWRQLKAFAEKIKRQNLSPILLVENPTIPDWIWDWQHPSVDGAPNNVPTDLTVTHDTGQSEDDSYLCNLNDIPVHSAAISPGSSLLMVKESLNKITFKKLADDIFVEAKIENINGNMEKINLLLCWEMSVEVNLYPAVRLVYDKNSCIK